MSTQEAVKDAARYCKEQGLQFTDPRRYVLAIIASSKKPVGAYEILEQLGKRLDNPKPPTVYRALEFLQQHGFIHCIESLNAYMSCHAHHRHQGSQFMICDSCGTVTEAHLCEMPADLKKKINKEGFALAYWNAEIHGLCKSCMNKGANPGQAQAQC